MTSTSGIALIPREGFFCKDGRGWHTSSSGRGHALEWPFPSTVLGALRTASGRDAEIGGRALTAEEWRDHAQNVSIRKPLALRRPIGAAWKDSHRIWPVPMDAAWLEEKDATGEAKPRRHRLKPRDPGSNGAKRVETLGRRVEGCGAAQEAAREALWFPELDDDAKPLSRPRWWSDEAFVAWLCGDESKEPPDKWGTKPNRRVQTRVALDPETGTADDAMLFSHDVIESLDRGDGESFSAHEWAIGVEATLPRPLERKTARLGSDSRLAWIETLDNKVFEAPEALIAAFDKAKPKGIRLVFVTPAKFKANDRKGHEGFGGGWLPTGFKADDVKFKGQLRGLTPAEVVLRAAFVPRPQHVSGWNMTGGGSRKNGQKANGGGPKETSRLVAPGAVYFFTREGGGEFTGDDARNLWLSSFGARHDEGFGYAVPGIWNPKGIN